MARKRGTTLLELLIAMALIGLVLSLLSSVLVPARRAWMRADRRSQAQQSAVLVLSRVREEVRRAQPDQLLCLMPAGDTTADTLLFVSWQGALPTMLWTANGEVLWQSKVAVYLDPTSGQVRVQRTLLPGPTPDAPPLVDADFQPLPTDHRVAGFVQSMAFAPVGPGTVQMSVQTSVEGETATVEGSAASSMPPEATPLP